MPQNDSTNTTKDSLSSPTTPNSPQAENIQTTLDQLKDLRSSLYNTTINYLRNELNKTIAIDQTNRLLNHPGTKQEINYLIQRTTLDPQQNLNSLSYELAKKISQASEPHVRLAVSLSAGPSNIKPEDVLQEVIRTNNQVHETFEPIKDYLKPIDGDGLTSRLLQQIQSPLIVGPNNIPTLKPELDKIVAIGLSSAAPEKQAKIANDIHQDLLGDILTTPLNKPVNINELIKNRLKKHGVDTNQIDSSALRRFADYTAKLYETASLDPKIHKLQSIAEANNLNSENIQHILLQINKTPEDIVAEINPNAPASSTSAPAPETPSYSPSNIDQAIEDADIQSSEQLEKEQGFQLNRVFKLINKFIKEQQTIKNNFSRFKRFIKSFSKNRQGSPFNFGFYKNQQGTQVGKIFSNNNFNNFVKTGARGLGNFIKSGAKGLGKLGVKAAQGLGSLITKIAVALGPEVLAAAGVVLLIVIGILAVLAFFNLSGASPEKITAMQTDSISGLSGREGCEGEDCSWPVQCGCITQGPYAGTHSMSKLNAIDIMTYMCPGFVTVNSVTQGTVSYIYDSLSAGEPGGPGNYGNHVIINSNVNGKDIQILYAHMIDIQVAVGGTVEIGTTIGTADTTGMGDAHLHFEVRGGAVQDVLPQESLNIPDYCSNLQECGGICLQN